MKCTKRVLEFLKYCKKNPDYLKKLELEFGWLKKELDKIEVKHDTGNETKKSSDNIF